MDVERQLSPTANSTLNLVFYAAGTPRAVFIEVESVDPAAGTFVQQP